MESRTMMAGQIIQLGQNGHPGTYFCRAGQDKEGLKIKIINLE
jgi:hypothetical protein